MHLDYHHQTRGDHVYCCDFHGKLNDQRVFCQSGWLTPDQLLAELLPLYVADLHWLLLPANDIFNH